MGIESIPSSGRLVMGVLWSREKDLEVAENLANGLFGPVEFRSENIPFSKYTLYYEKEMGKDLHRCFWAFKEPFQRGALVEAKLATNRVERKLARSGKRTVNLDPGVLTLEALNLATTKAYHHRIYLEKGIFGELTLFYGKGGFEPLPWTYPDYRDGWATEFFTKVRGKMLEERRRGKGRTEE